MIAELSQFPVDLTTRSSCGALTSTSIVFAESMRRKTDPRVKLHGRRRQMEAIKARFAMLSHEGGLYAEMENCGGSRRSFRRGRSHLGLRAAEPGTRVLRVARLTALPGKRDALAERFASRTAAIFARLGITNVGYWIPQESDAELGISAENTFIYIRGYPSKEERDKRLQARADDPEFTEVVRKAESNPATKLIAKVHNIDMVPHGPYTAITLAK